MKKAIIILTVLFATMANAQEQKQIPQINVSGEGKIKVTPDKVSINFGVTNIGKEASEVKKLNDETIDKVMKFIKKFGIAATDYQINLGQRCGLQHWDCKDARPEAGRTCLASSGRCDGETTSFCGAWSRRGIVYGQPRIRSIEGQRWNRWRCGWDQSCIVPKMEPSGHIYGC